MPSQSESSWDLIIIGAGPAGTSTCLAALQVNPNLKILLIDKSSPGRDKVCGDGLGPDVPPILDQLGVGLVLKPEEMVLNFVFDDYTGAKLSTTSPKPGYVIPRAIFDHRLLQEALNKGVFFSQETVTDVTQNDFIVTVKTRLNNVYKAPYIVAADGASSIVRRKLGVSFNKGRHLAVAIRGYTNEPNDNNLLIRWDNNNPYSNKGLAYAWNFPTANSVYNIGYGMSLTNGPVSKKQLLSRLQSLKVTDTDLTSIDFVGHQLPLSTSQPDPVVNRVLLTGDAASLINPLSGEGIIYALISGQLAGNAVASNPKEAGSVYKANLHTRLSKHHLHVNTLARLTRFPQLVTRTINAASKDPHTLNKILELSLGEGSISYKDFTRFVVAFSKAGMK
jgi:geranylgeranyl reductase family protein